MNASGFMHKYYDWADFERFVQGLYEGDGNVLVERDVTETDRHGSKRQTDIKITRRVRFNTFTTLVECKRWKEPVSRDRIDVLAASIEALGASNGAIFTTTGFEAGAINAAKAKGIELFVVRDLTDEEWGLPGRHIKLHLQVAAAELKNMKFDAMATPLIEQMPEKLELHAELSKEKALDPGLDLFSVKTGTRGPNLTSLLADTHEAVLRQVTKSVSLINAGRDGVVEIVSPCELDLTKTEYCQLRLPSAAVRIGKVWFLMYAEISQSTIEFDRGEDLDFAVMVESFVSDQRMIAHRKTPSQEIEFEIQGSGAGEVHSEDDKVVENGSTIVVQCSPYVGVRGNATIKALAKDLFKVIVETDGMKPQLSVTVQRSD
ncbi:restriction endonuclease [Pseudomonas syringae]|nr:restriction endonuclease [Pseudomonas syringae]